ncbi:hypothetical protein [Prevotella histicola]
MKKLLYSCIAFCTLVLAGCADQDVAETNATNNDGPGVKVSMTMEGEMQSDAAAATPNSRAIGYEVKDDNGFPTAKGLYNGVGASAQELATGTKVPVVLIFKSDNASQPVTKVKTMWTYTQGGKLTLEPSETFEMKSGTNLSQGTWYVCGILGGDLDNTNSNVKFDGFVEGYTPKDNSGNKTTFGADIPYIFGWRKLETNQAKKTIKTNHAVKFKQFGSIVRLKVTNNTGFGIKYDGVRIITSNILVGQFDLSSFDNVATSDLADTQDGVLNDATSNDYKKVFKAFNFTQRATTDAKITSLASTNNFSMHNDLSYYDYKFNDFVTLANGGSATGYVYVWMAPKQQTVNIYNKEENNGAPVETKQVSKTQFMLMAMPTETSAGNKVVPTSINMIPAYGTRADYVSGRNYPAKGSVVYNFPPLSYIAKHDNFGTEAELSSTANQDIAHTIRYTYSQVEANKASIPSNYFIAGNEYWRSLITQAYAFAGLGKSWSSATNSYSADYTYSMSMVSPAKLPGWSNTLLVYQTYSKAVKDKNGKNVAYMLGLSKKPDYISDDTEGQVYRGRTKNPAIRVRSGLGDNLNWITNNNYRYTVRYEKVGSTVEMKQRYLGPRFVLDMEDIDNEDFWNEVPSGFPEDAKRVIPLPGVYTFVEVPISGPRGKQQFWLLNQNSVGNSAQYWTLDDASQYARYALAKTGGPNASVTGYTDYTSDKDGKAPKQAVGFGMPDLSAGMGGFYYYVYRGTPVYQDNDLNPADPRYVKNLIMQVPVRLWRKTTPYAD